MSKKEFKKEALTQARGNAQNWNIECSISEKDIILPNKCSLLDIPLDYNIDENTCINSAQLIRLNKKLGYTKNNILIISEKARKVVDNLSLHEIKLLAENLEQKIVESKIHEDRKDK